jgi:hypothetical protein
VYLAPPARQKHIAHYICLDKAEQKFGGDVLQIDNARADGTLWRAAVSVDGPRAPSVSAL